MGKWFESEHTFANKVTVNIGDLVRVTVQGFAVEGVFRGATWFDTAGPCPFNILVGDTVIDWNGKENGEVLVEGSKKVDASAAYDVMMRHRNCSGHFHNTAKCYGAT